MKKTIYTIIITFSVSFQILAQASHSVAREWNDLLLTGIRNDFARPTVHARNLFHLSAAMYDAWAVYDETAVPFLIGRTVWDFKCDFNGISQPADIKAAREESISFAIYRLMRHRFNNSPGSGVIIPLIDEYMNTLGYDIFNQSTDYENGGPAELGNYIAECYINFGLQDGSNEAGSYANLIYTPINDPLDPTQPGNPTISDPNHWQPLTLGTFIDQGGNPIPINTPPFLSPEWGNVVPFSLKPTEKITYERDGSDYYVYHDPGMPAEINLEDQSGTTEHYKWNHSLVAIWSGHLDPFDGVMWDISPASIGNIDLDDYPQSLEDYADFYNLLEGGDPSQGHELNPVTNMPYEPQIVPRGDYARVLAEFWADGPDSETPPGHWFTILNYVNDHPSFEKRMGGQGEILDELEWDVKAYFALGGAMHDVAVSSWGIKGWYDYIRPISAIRFMADRGQSTSAQLPNFDPNGIPLVEGYVELVDESDPLAGASNENVGKIKLKAWKGHVYISDPEVEQAGVDWILAENWWPYQRPSFVTPPFAGYVSGHSTYSRAAAELMTLLTGDAFFPGGLGEFEAPMNEFLVFEEGPSMDITLQWATYIDASEQCSLSRIWGGIHPPIDDIPGRLIGIKIGPEAFEYAQRYFDGSSVTGVSNKEKQHALKIYPNPVLNNQKINVELLPGLNDMKIINLHGQLVYKNQIDAGSSNRIYEIDANNFHNGVYVIQIENNRLNSTAKIILH